MVAGNVKLNSYRPADISFAVAVWRPTQCRAGVSRTDDLAARYPGSAKRLGE